MSAPLRIARFLAALGAALTVPLLAAPAALGDNGEGLAGSVSDKTVTFFAFGVIGFFAVLVIVLSLVQEGLERRKQLRRSDFERLR